MLTMPEPCFAERFNELMNLKEFMELEYGSIIDRELLVTATYIANGIKESYVVDVSIFLEDNGLPYIQWRRKDGRICVITINTGSICTGEHKALKGNHDES